ncbi:MAG: hypothetical protein NTW54_08670 [Bacteroidetes bacterium]|nr:hypothetical protein [Bacteroidota bacterium]
MNYLSHFYFYSKEHNPYYNCGLIFPDWLSSYQRLRLNKPIIATNRSEEHLVKGIQNHFLGDKTFHSSDYFKEHTQAIKRILEKTSLDKNRFRFSFLAHVLLEMMIDRLLLLKNSELGSLFYDNLDACDDELLLYFAQNNSDADEGFKLMIQKFKQYRYILQYVDVDTFVYSFRRIASRVGIVFEEMELTEIKGQIRVIENIVERSFSKIVTLFDTHEK